MNKTFVLLLVTITWASQTFATPFSVEKEFFDRNGWKHGEHVSKTIRPEKCKDGSNFFSLSIGKTNRSEVTCLYEHDEIALTVQHVWEDEKKVEEYSTVNHKLHGKHIYRAGPTLYFVSEYCNGELLSTELESEGKVFAVALYAQDKETPYSVVNFDDFNKSENPYLSDLYKPCVPEFKVENELFDKWLKRDWKNFRDFVISESARDK